MRRWHTPVTRLRTTWGQDRYGDPAPTGVERSELPPALYAPGATSDPVQDGARPILADAALYWRKVWPDISPTDRLIVHGRTFEVMGQPKHWPQGLVVELALIDNPQGGANG